MCCRSDCVRDRWRNRVRSPRAPRLLVTCRRLLTGSGKNAKPDRRPARPPGHDHWRLGADFGLRSPVIIDGGRDELVSDAPGRSSAADASGGAIPPVEHPERAEGVPAARRPHAVLDVEVDPTRVDAVDQPPAVRLPFRPHHLHGLCHPGIRDRARPAEVVERAQHVVVPVVGESEIEICRVGDRAGALAAEQAALEEVLLTAAPGSVHLAGPAGCSLELEQPVEYVDRGVEGGPHGTVLDLAVPAAVAQPLAEDPLDVRRDIHPEVRPGLDRPTVNARLDLAVEVALPFVLPAPVLRDERDRPAGGLRRRVEPEELQRLQRVHRGRPWLPWFAAGVGRGEAGAAIPEPIGTLEPEEARAPTVVLDSGPLGRDLIGGPIPEVVQHLPADGGVAVEQPVDHAHRRTVTRSTRQACEGLFGPPAECPPRRLPACHAQTDGSVTIFFPARKGHETPAAFSGFGPRGRRWPSSPISGFTPCSTAVRNPPASLWGTARRSWSIRTWAWSPRSSTRRRSTPSEAISRSVIAATPPADRRCGRTRNRPSSRARPARSR